MGNEVLIQDSELAEYIELVHKLGYAPSEDDE